MRRLPDPAWIGFANRLFAAFLWLFPSDLRHAHGDEMRQVFRDRCREVAGQPARIAHLMFAEMLPDTVASASEAQWSAGIGTPGRRHGVALGVLLLAAGWLLFQDSISRFVLDWGHEVKIRIAHRQEVARLAAEEGLVRALPDALARETTPASKAIAAYFYRALYVHRIGFWVEGENVAMHPREHYAADLGVLVEDGARATHALAAIGGAEDPWIATLALQACETDAGCNRAQAVERLLRLEPDNAFGWAQAFKAASLAGDRDAKRRALSRMAAARYYDDHLGEILSEVFAASARLLPQDPHKRALVARYAAEAGSADTDYLQHDVRLECRSAPPGTRPATWNTGDPGIAADCLAVARLLAASDGPWNAYLGWREIDQREQTPATARALEQAKALTRHGRMNVGASPRGGVDAQGRTFWYPWDDAEWNRWAASWTPEMTELDNVRKRAGPHGKSAPPVPQG